MPSERFKDFEVFKGLEGFKGLERFKRLEVLGLANGRLGRP